MGKVAIRKRTDIEGSGEMLKYVGCALRVDWGAKLLCHAPPQRARRLRLADPQPTAQELSARR